MTGRKAGWIVFVVTLMVAAAPSFGATDLGGKCQETAGLSAQAFEGYAGDKGQPYMVGTPSETVTVGRYPLHLLTYHFGWKRDASDDAQFEVTVSAHSSAVNSDQWSCEMVSARNLEFK